MKRISILACILCAYFVSTAWAQHKSSTPLMGRNGSLRHHGFHAMPTSVGTIGGTNFSTEEGLVKTVKFYDLGTYLDGTYTQVWDINSSGAVVGLGDTSAGYDANLDPARGYSRPLVMPLFGPQAMQWFDLGTFGGESYGTNFHTADTAAAGVSDTGMVVGLAPRADQYIRAFAWTPGSGKTDLGALESLGYLHSNAIAVNRLATLVVGWSGASNAFSLPSLPVAWTPSVEQKHGRPAIMWKIHQLSTSGFEQFPYWVANGVNDFGQVVGAAFDDSGSMIAVHWTPLRGGKGWKAIQLPIPPEYPEYMNAWCGTINEKGEIVGIIFNADLSSSLPALWRPVDRHRHAYKLTLLRTLSGLQQGVEDGPMGINDLGDIVGTTYDPPDYNPVATLWSTKDPNFVQALDFQGHFGAASRINNFRFVSGWHFSDDCPNGCAAVAQLR